MFASLIHISGPLAMVVAGIITGNKGKREAMSDVTKDYLNKFWELTDEILNALLFMLIGFEMIVLAFDHKTSADRGHRDRSCFDSPAYFCIYSHFYPFISEDRSNAICFLSLPGEV